VLYHVPSNHTVFACTQADLEIQRHTVTEELQECEEATAVMQEKCHQELQSLSKQMQQSQADEEPIQDRVDQLKTKLQERWNADVEAKLEVEQKALAKEQQKGVACREKHEELEKNTQVQFERAQQKQKEVCAVIKEQADKVCGTIPKFKVSKKVSSKLVCFPCVEFNAHHTAHVVLNAYCTWRLASLCFR